jgi:predicted secreted protein
MNPRLAWILPVLIRASSVSFPQSGGEATVSVPTGSEFKIRLQTNPSTGFDWFLVNAPECVEADDPVFVSDEKRSKHIVGSPSVKEFKFKASSTCDSTILLEYKRAWETQRPFATATIRVNVYDDDELL